MKGSIHAIWLTNNGKLHPQVIPNLSALVQDASQHGFEIILWTNLKQVSKIEIQTLTNRNVRVKDYSDCYSSQFYNHFINFFDKGMQGDKAAFALASDILRMSILELVPNDQYYIYFDPNDVTFLNFNKSLSQLDHLMSINSLGFSFYVNILSKNETHIRNDVLIAKKEVNLQFFQDYFAAYAAHLDANSGKYFKPLKNNDAVKLAAQISAQTSTNFFEILFIQPIPTVKATFGQYAEFYLFVNCLAQFPYLRHMQNANTWLPHELDTEECPELKIELRNDTRVIRPELYNQVRSSFIKNADQFKQQIAALLEQYSLIEKVNSSESVDIPREGRLMSVNDAESMSFKDARGVTKHKPTFFSVSALPASESLDTKLDINSECVK